MKHIRLIDLHRTKVRVVFCVMTLFLATSAPGTHAALGFDPLHGVVTDTLVVSVTIDASVTDLRGFTFTLEFDPSIVMPIAVNAGGLVASAGCPNVLVWMNAASIGDSIVVDGATLGCSVAGPGAIVDITFVGVGFGISPLECQRSELRDSLNMSVSHICPDGTLTRAVVAIEGVKWAQFKRLFR